MVNFKLPLMVSNGNNIEPDTGIGLILVSVLLGGQLHAPLLPLIYKFLRVAELFGAPCFYFGEYE